MATQKNIQLYIYVDGINDIPFYGTSCDVNNGNENVPNCEQVEIGAFKYEAKRMGGLPTISFTLYYPSSLEGLWNDNIYGLFNGRKFFLKQTPSEKISNDNLMYEYSVELVDERIILDNTYFFNAVAEGDTEEYDQPITNNTTFNFFGDINKFAKMLNSSLRFSKLQGTDSQGKTTGYSVVIDEGVSSEEKFISFSDKFFSEAIQESYNTFEIPYYFVGKTIHIGYKASNIEYPFETGIDNSLLTINKQNANTRSINRATAVGSSENIPFYYPNKSPKGDIGISVDTSSPSLSVEIKDVVKFATRVSLNEPITAEATKNIQFSHSSGFTLQTTNTEELDTSRKELSTTQSFQLNKGGYVSVRLDTSIISITATDTTVNGVLLPKEVDYSEVRFAIYKSNNAETNTRLQLVDSKTLTRSKNEDGTYNNSNVLLNVNEGGSYILVITQTFKRNGYYSTMTVQYTCTAYMEATDASMIADAENLLFGGWYYKGKEVNLNDLGLQYTGTPKVGDTIRQVSGKYITPSPVLLPPIYRNTSGNERFYNALNNTYTVNGRTLSFVKPYIDGKPRENIYKNEDIKPSIVGETNSMDQRIDMFDDIAFDYGDNDDTYEDEETHRINYVHPYFFVKLRRLPFNLFDQALENGGAMTIEMTSGRCGGCKFEIAVDDESKMNTVQVWDGKEKDENDNVPAMGTLKRDENGRVVCGVNYFQDSVQVMQDIQNDTVSNEVWIALRKEEDTYGVLMPNAAENYYPEAGDTFVITNIKLPDAYIMRAEERLRDYLLTSMENDNPEKFNFSMGLSRIFLEENPTVLASLDENSSLGVKHDGVVYNQYVSTYTYTMGENDILPEIKVTLVDSLSVSANNLQKIASQVNMQMIQALNGINLMSLVTPYFLRKDQDDEANGIINFKRGIKFGESGKVDMMPDNGAKLTIDYLEVNKKATFNSIEIAEKKHVGGQVIITPSAMKCGEVEVMEELGVFRCYFQTKEGTDSKIMNQFVVGDLAICQTYNEVGSKYYWRAVVGVGEDYIDLSINDCDEYSDIPEAGDTIIQLGNKTDKTRQAAIILSAYDDNAPSLIMYNEINDYTLDSKNITGIVWNPDKQEPQTYSYGSFFFGDRELKNNFITFQKKEGDTDKNLYINGKVTIGAGSAGLSNLEEWSDKQTQINNAESTANKAKTDAANAQSTANDAKAKAEDAQSRAMVLESTTSNLSTQITDLENNVTDTVEEINKRLDGVVENYFEEGVPTLENYPANQWKTDTEKKNHIGDTFTNINTYEVDPDNAGKSWRWVATDAEHSGYHWHPIADSDAVKALQDAAKAQSTADGKSTTFLRQPTNYSKGDLWVLQSDNDHTAGKKGEILTANTSSAAYNASHWSKEIIYTDDKALEEFLDGAYKETVNNLKEQIQSTREILDGINNDHVLDSTEKSYIRTLWENINGIPSLVTVGSTGSYISTLEMVEKAGYKSGQEVLLTFNGKTLVFNGKQLVFKHLGIEDFKVTYLNLRQYLTDMRLYDGSITEGYDRLKMSSLFTAYYDAQGKLLENAQYYYADMSAKDTLNQFIQGDYADEISGLKASLDEKAETYMQNTDPAACWTTNEVKAKHVSDIWWNSSDSEVSGVDAGATAIYRYDGSKYYWEQSPVPKAIFDEIDGKNSIYVSKPKNYKARDMWIMEEGLTAGDVPADCVPGDILIATATSETYSAAHWKKFVRYTDDSALQTFITGVYADTIETLRGQIDGKAQSFVQSSDPASEWLTTEVKKAHVGDMWLNTSSTAISGIGSMKTAMYKFVDGNFQWVQQNIPNELFDQIDGKAQIFVTTPTSYHENDMWIIGNDISSLDMPSGASVGELMVSTKDSSSYNKSHWVKKVKYTDDKALEEFLDGAYKETVNNLKEQIQSTREAIERMNSDHVLDESEKSYIRTEWEQINGYPCFDKIGSTGSYQTTLDIIAASGYTIGEAVTLTFNGKKLTFNGKSLTFNYRGMDSFKAAYYNLRDFLDESELYNVGSTDGFDREKLARLFSAYYDAQAILIDNSQKYYASKKAEESASSYKDDMAKKLGYSSYDDMEAQVKKNGSIIMEGGYLNAQLIEAQAITGEKIAAGAITSDKIEAKAINAEKVDIDDLFSNHIEANDMSLNNGCTVGDNVEVKDGKLSCSDTFGDYTYLTEIFGGTVRTKVPTYANCGQYNLEIGGCSGAPIMVFGSKAAPYCTIPTVDDLINGTYRRLECAALLDVKDGLSFYSPNGEMAGVRPLVYIAKQKEMEIGSEIESWVNTIIAKYTTGEQTIRLPSNPQKGDWYRIINTYDRGKNKLTILAYHDVEYKNGKSKSLYTSERDVLEYIFDGYEWHQIHNNI